MSVNICKKTFQRFSCQSKFILSSVVFQNAEGIGNGISLIFYHMDNRMQFLVHLPVLFIGTAVNSIVLYGNRIGKLIVSQKFAVAVKNTSSGSGSNPLFLNAQGIIVQIFLSVDNLKYKNPLKQHSKQPNHNHAEHK